MNNSDVEAGNSDALKDLTEIMKKINGGETNLEDEVQNIENASNYAYSENSFKVCSNNLPEKTGVWTKIKNALFYEVKVALTPYEQKVEDEINDFLYQDITWGKVHDFFAQEVAITYKGKRVF